MSVRRTTAGVSLTNAGTTDSRTFTGKAPSGATASVLKNGNSVATVTATGGLLTYTFATPQLTTDSIVFAVSTAAKSGQAVTLPAGTPVLTGTAFDTAALTAGQALSNSNRTLASSTSSNPNGLRTLASFATGKRYIEFTINTIMTNTQVAIVASGTSMTNGGNGFAGFDTAVTIRWDGAIYKGSGFANPNNIGALASGDIIGIAVDRTNGVYFVRKNGGPWFGTGGSGKDPTVSAQGDPLPSGLTSATIYYAAIAGNSGGVVTMNPTPSSVPTGYSTLSSNSNPSIAVLMIAGQSNASGTGQGAQASDGASVAWTPDPLVFTWDGGKLVDYVPGNRTGFEFGQWDIDGSAGPEIGFILAWRAANPGLPLVVLKTAARGTQLASSGSTAVYDWAASGSSGELFDQAATLFTNAKAAISASGYTPNIIALFWMQGEADASNSTNASNYQTNLTALVTGARNSWGLGTAPFIIGRIRDAFSPGSPNVRSAQFNVAAANPGGPVGLIETSDIPVGADNTHYTIPGRTTLGQRIYAWTQNSYTEPTS